MVESGSIAARATLAGVDAHRPVFCESRWKRNCIWLSLPTRKAGTRIALETTASLPDSSGTLTRFSSSLPDSGRKRYERTSCLLISTFSTESL